MDVSGTAEPATRRSGDRGADRTACLGESAVGVPAGTRRDGAARYRIGASMVQRILRRGRIGPAPRAVHTSCAGVPACPGLRAAGLRFSFRSTRSAFSACTSSLCWTPAAAGCTSWASAPYPSAGWVAQQARNLSRDQDREGPPRTPRSNCLPKRFVRTIGTECTDRLLIYSQRQAAAVLSEYAAHYSDHRPHQSRNQLPPALGEPATVQLDAAISRRKVLERVINEYTRAV